MWGFAWPARRIGRPCPSHGNAAAFASSNTTSAARKACAPSSMENGLEPNDTRCPGSRDRWSPINDVADLAYLRRPRVFIGLPSANAVPISVPDPRAYLADLTPAPLRERSENSVVEIHDVQFLFSTMIAVRRTSLPSRV